MQTSSNRKEPSLVNKPNGVELPTQLPYVLGYCPEENYFVFLLLVFWPFSSSKWFKLVNYCSITVSTSFNGSYKYEIRIVHNRWSFSLHENAPWHTVNPVRGTLETLSWEVLHHETYSADLTPSDCHLFSSIGHAFPKQRFNSYEDI